MPAEFATAACWSRSKRGQDDQTEAPIRAGAGIVAAVIAASLALISGSGAAAGEDGGAFAATALGAGTYDGHQGPVRIEVGNGEARDMVTVVGDMPVGSNVGFHYHPGHAFVVVTKGRIASLDSAACPAGQTYEAGDAFFDFPDHVHDIVNVGGEPAQFVVTFLHGTGEEPLYPVEDPGAENCHH